MRNTLVGRVPEAMGRSSSILAIDLGTTRCKAAVYDFGGSMLASVSRERDGDGPAGGIDPNVARWKRDVAWCARSAVKAARREIDRIVITGQGSSAIWLDEQGELVRPVILHTDMRTVSQAEALTREFESIGYVPSKVYPSLLWLKENEKSKFMSIRHVLDIRQFIGYRLTGEMRYDTRSFTKLENEKFAAMCGLDPEVFGEPHDYSKPIGFLRDSMAEAIELPRGVPVFVGPMDGLCGIIGSGIHEEGQMTDLAGSTEVMATPVPRGSKLAMLTLLDTGIDLFYTSPPFGLAYNWFLDRFYPGKKSAYKAIASDVSESSADLDRPFYIPGLKPMGPQRSLRSAFFNLALNHSRGDMARALFEGIAFEVARVVDRLGEEGVSIGEIRLSGGGAYQEVWNQMRADATGKEVVLPRVLETSSLGAAIVAASSSMGPYKGVEEGMSKMVKMGKRYRPRKAAVEAYRERLVMHRRYADLLAGTW